MNLTTVREIYRSRETYLDKEVQIGGWVRSVRGSKNFGFIVVSDGSYFETLQVVYHDTMPNFAEISKLNVGASIIVKGTLVATPEAKQPFEIQATEVAVEIIRFRRNATALSICVPSPTCVREPTPSRLCSVYVPWQLTRSISISRSAISCMSTLH